VPPPYEKRYSSKTPPPGAKYTNITGKGMAKKTLQMIGGPAPKTADVRLGFMDVHITKGSTKIEFIPTRRGRENSILSGKNPSSFIKAQSVTNKPSIRGKVQIKKVNRVTDSGFGRIRV
jgi:hypothetical protein